MRITKELFQLTIVLLLFNACDSITGKEVARIAINEASSPDNLIVKDVSLDLKNGDEIIFWSDMDMEYEGNVDLRFRVQILKDGEEFGSLEIDPTDKNVTIGEIKTSIMNKTNWRFSGRNTKIKIDSAGKYVFKALLATSDNPSLKIKKAEIVIKQ